ncbi:MAG: hypothetical protein DID92_2727743065 [Candidatus Nitrotoga sp. SPKER]|nr:MAG: hypothetical protein DID92_2727743065 [Candidatus Nitrotoga sp. SPKER]
MPPPLVVFLRPSHGYPFMGGLCGKAQALPVPFPVFEPAHVPPSLSFEARQSGLKPYRKELHHEPKIHRSIRTNPHPFYP